MDFLELRKKYISEKLDEKEVSASPFDQFKKWFKQATIAKLHEPSAAILATVGDGTHPSARTVLMKGFDEKGIIFFTNYESKKANDLTANPNAAILFYWGELERQVRIEGSVIKVSLEESDKYFKTRPVGSRLGAWASPQSQVIPNREWLEERHNKFREQYENGEIPRPSNWGGYLLTPVSIEFWQGRANRLHDRVVYRREGNEWTISRLAP
jgi:pyridoxamine 5'-phosphate oxidase